MTVCRILRCLRVGVLAGICWVAPAFGQEIRFDGATISTVIDGVAARDSVTLPFRWDQHYPGHAGIATLEFAFAQSELPPAPWGLFLPKLGSAYVVSLNGSVIAHDGDMERYGGSDTGKAPRLVVVPREFVQAQNVLTIRLRADKGRKAGLSGAVISSWERAQAHYWRHWRFGMLGLIAVVIFSLLVGVLSFVLWLSQPGFQGGMEERRDPLYLFSALAEVCWAIRVSDSLLEVPPLPWPVWGVVPVLALGAWGCLTALVCMEVVRWRNARWAPALRTWMRCLMAAGCVMVSVGLLWGVPTLVTAWYALVGVTFLVFSVFLVKRSFGREGTLAGRLLAGAVLLNAAVGMADLVRLRTSAGAGDVSMLYYSSLLFGLVIAYVVISRFRRASVLGRELFHTLEQRLDDKEAEVRASYLQLEAQSREQARVAERTRILRDMHDGVGSHISVAIRQLQGGVAAREDVLQTLQESMDQLKLSIDCMHLPPGDISSVLANVRYRMEPRLVPAGIQVVWDVEFLPLMVRWDEKATRQFQFMVYECISNVLQHAQASEIRIMAREAQGGALITIADNGRGFEVDRAGKRGLQAIRQRAGALGAELRLSSRPGETVVEIAIAWG